MSSGQDCSRMKLDRMTVTEKVTYSVLHSRFSSIHAFFLCLSQKLTHSSGLNISAAPIEEKNLFFDVFVVTH